MVNEGQRWLKSEHPNGLHAAGPVTEKLRLRMSQDALNILRAPVPVKDLGPDLAA